MTTKYENDLGYSSADYGHFIHASRYAKWLNDESRRETWEETVDRYIKHMCDYECRDVPDAVSPETREELKQAIFKKRVMPSMRAMMTSGKALELDSMCGYNCTFAIINDKDKFSEILQILMCGTGVGFSCERQHISKLPIVPEGLHKNEQGAVFVIDDSRIGWAEAFKHLINSLYSGCYGDYDFTKIRPKGDRLMTMGGRASGPAPLQSLFSFTIGLFASAAGKGLNSREVHDLVCNIADVVVVGGVRRSALISLSNLSDHRMRNAKTGEWWKTHKYLAMANNSVCYTEKPDPVIFGEEWLSLWKSMSGERGIFNRVASEKQVLKNGRRKGGYEWGTNPCSEIILRPDECCNLTEVVVAYNDTEETLKEKIKAATILGTIQSKMVDFKFIGKSWAENCKQERLLGVSLTGIFDNKFFGTCSPQLCEALERLREYSVEVNKEWAGKLGIPVSAAITCVKPSGTVSQLVDSASGIHPRYSEYYVRTVRCDKKDPIYAFMKDQGVPVEDELNKPKETAVFSFPIKAPQGATTRDDIKSPIDHLELWLVYQRHWCEHKPSVTVQIKDDEWLKVGAWVWEHFDEISGVSFLPYDGGSYQQAPYQPISEKEYNERSKSMPRNIDWSLMRNYEKQETDRGRGVVMACTAGGGCEDVDVSEQ